MYSLKDLNVWLWCVIFGAAAFIGGIFCESIDRQVYVPKSQTVLVDPNDVKVNGDLAQMKGTAEGVAVLVTAKLDSAAQKAQLEKNTRWFKLKIKEEFTRIEGARNVAEFDYAKYEHRQVHCDYTVFINHFEPILVKENGWRKLLGFKKKLNLYLSTFPRYSRIFYKMLIGDQDDLLGKDQLSRLGLLSLLSLGGMQLYFWLDIWRSLGARLRITEDKVNIFCLFFLLLIICLYSDHVGLMRSAIFLFVSRLMRLFGKKYSSLDLWSFIFLFFIAVKPYLLFNLGGILSFLITFFMQTKVRENRWITNIKINILILPVILQQIYVWNFMSLVTNAIFFPVISFLFPLFCLNWVLHFPLIDQVINFGCYVLFQIINGIARIKAFNLVYGKIPVVMALILTFAGLWILSKKSFKLSNMLVLFTTYLTLFLMIHFPLSGRVIMFDIGQGDSLLIETPFHRQIILIDTGGKLAFNNSGWQARKRKARVDTVTLNYLHSRGISHLDAVVTTHQDADHIGDLPELIKKIRIDRLIYGNGILDNEHYLKKVAPLKKQTKFIPVQAGQVVNVKGQHLQILNPDQPGLGENTDSVTFLTKVGQLKFLFTGDLDQAGERRIMQKFSVKTDILKAGHHGSKTSTSPEFLKKSAPKMAWISVGQKNRYGHPSPETLHSLEQKKIPWLATKDVGMVYYEYNLFKNELKCYKKDGFK
ncbi:ComEC/Rec2 family competence protein [Xylocopilactobacillus apis]|uniref:ComEC/Rec2 family competence protein n=1 Tax=Xylocopilactobacillus apis TaxID=2932183 RepID=UPI002952AE15|nr:ComEC/Rec2 family competence protein [Xylocopilactobacillus apis]